MIVYLWWVSILVLETVEFFLLLGDWLIDTSAYVLRSRVANETMLVVSSLLIGGVAYEF